MITLILLVIALVLFVIDGVASVNTPYKLTALGLAFLTGALLVHLL